MSWRKVLRSLEVDARRRSRRWERERQASEREALRSMREMQRLHRAQEKAEAAEGAAHEAATFENYLGLIVSVHKDCGAQWDWAALAQAPSPPSPIRRGANEIPARRALDTYKPGFFERLFGKDKKKRAILEQRRVEAQAEDARAHDEALKEHQAVLELWQLRRTLGARVLAKETSAYREALDHAVPFDELDSYDTRVTIAALDPDAAVVNCEITDPEVVPTEELKVTAGGKLSTKAMPAGRYWSLYQDYVCSCAIRVARETLAVLPIARAIINVGTVKLDTSTGHPGLVTLLTAGLARETLERLNLTAIDPSDAMKNFPHRMKFKKTVGFDPVEPILLDEGWVSAG